MNIYEAVVHPIAAFVYNRGYICNLLHAIIACNKLHM